MSEKKIQVKAAPIISKSFAPIIADIVMLILGICLLIWHEQVLNIISMAIGALFILYSVYNLLAYARIKEKRSGDIKIIVTAVALLIAGIFLIVRADFIKEVISFIIGAYLVITSLLHMQNAITSNKQGNSLPLILAIVGLACGILCVLGRLALPGIMVQILGAMLIMFAFCDIVGVSIVRKQ